jgi:uncharacterized protein with PQ loop repeat
LAGAFNPQNAGVTKKNGNAATSATLGTYPQIHRSYRSRKNTKYISISKYIKVMSVESEAYWQTPVK